MKKFLAEADPVITAMLVFALLIPIGLAVWINIAQHQCEADVARISESSDREELISKSEECMKGNSAPSFCLCRAAKKMNEERSATVKKAKARDLLEEELLKLKEAHGNR